MIPKEIHKDKGKPLSEDSPCSSAVKKWVADYKQGRESALMMAHIWGTQNQQPQMNNRGHLLHSHEW